ncbi:hypothetical protein BCR32DRAFT_292356 [Anaeromyces robustus]|uniref:Uncharacterized protein n=1 Tax=Anaeromyces robustus TaxID=1754192 RepID=A0A1Y1XAZ0_9FUNG|nr:hypothetical protein BCR32DRAFT_292356 [Anaeromyces robustus]|eukprot:ORX82883.1 hypothetical protein BCR32DRAFT_292356 [Anaeromyces robustus]
MSFEVQIQRIQNLLFELDCPLAVHVVEEELHEPELKYQILEWLFEKYKKDNNEILDTSISTSTLNSTLKKSASSKLSSSSSLSSSFSSLDSRKKREASPLTKKKANPLDAKITNLVTNCAILGCCNIEDAILFTEKNFKPHVLNIYENLIEMINISLFFDSSMNEDLKINNPLKYPRVGVKDISDETTKDIDFLNDLCNSKNLSILSNKSCGNILSKDLAALVTVESNDNKKMSNSISMNQSIDLNPLYSEIEILKKEVDDLQKEYNLLRSEYKYADQDEEDNTQVLHYLYTLSKHLATYIEGFNLRFPLEIESWIYSNPNSNHQVYSEDLGNIISRLNVLLKNYHQIISNIANIKQGYEQLVHKPLLSNESVSSTGLESSTKNDDIAKKTTLLPTQSSPFNNNYSLHYESDQSYNNKEKNNKMALGGRINIDYEIKQIQCMENELQESIDILIKSQERKRRNNKNSVNQGIQIEFDQQPELNSNLFNNLSSSSDQDMNIPIDGVAKKEAKEVPMNIE